MTKITKTSKAKELKQKLYERKLELMKELSFDKELHTSKEGNTYVYLNSKTNRYFTHNTFNVLKSTVTKLFSQSSFPDSNVRNLLLIKPNGQVIVKQGKNKWKQLTLRAASMFIMTSQDRPDVEKEKFIEIATLGRKYEWLRNSIYKDLRPFMIAQQFKSFREFKIYMGYEFISDNVFLSFFTKGEAIDLLFATIQESQEFKVKLAGHFTTDCSEYSTLIKDTLKMSYDLGQPFILPKGQAALHEIHDRFVDIQNKAKAEEYPTNEIYAFTNIVELMNARGYVVELLNSPRALFLTGSLQRHCLAGYGHSLGQSLFISVSKYGEDKSYQAQILVDSSSCTTISGDLNHYANTNVEALVTKGKACTAKINQFLGYKNCAAPDDFKADLKSVFADSDFYALLLTPKDFKFRQQVHVFAEPTRYSRNVEYPFNPFNTEVQTLYRDKLLNPSKYQTTPQIEEQVAVYEEEDCPF